MRGLLSVVSGVITPVGLVVVVFSIVLVSGAILPSRHVNHNGRQGAIKVTRYSQDILALFDLPARSSSIHLRNPLRQPYMPKVYKPKVTPNPLRHQRLAPVFMRVDTKEPVIFITIDDGVYPSPAGLQYIYQLRAVASLFLYDNIVRHNYDYFKQWLDLGSAIQNHTISHPDMSRLSLDKQRHEICGDSDRLWRAFGVRPTLFRPPYGVYNNKTRRAVSECGLKALIWWSALVEDGHIEYQGVNKLRRGDIVLLHFTPKLAGDLKVLFKQATAQHLQIGRLEDWIR